MRWINCSDCDTEFRVISDTDSVVTCCPFCGSVLEYDEEEDEDDYE